MYQGESMEFTISDRQQLAAHDIALEKAVRQLERLNSGQVWIRLERPCVAGDGIIQIGPERRAILMQRFGLAAAAGRLIRFVPASGAATRMFKPLYADPEILEACKIPQADPDAGSAEHDLRRFFEHLRQFAFCPDLDKAMAEDGLSLDQAIAERDLATIIRYLLEPCGLGYASLPKGLLAFHQVADGARTPFIEHQAEAALLNGSSGQAVLHFTVSPDHQPLFEAQAAAWQSTLNATYGCQLEIGYSTQKPATDTLALADDDQPLRDSTGRLVLRPGGHGALIENLNDLGGDIVLIRNIDNVVPDAQKEANLVSTQLLTGILLELQEEQHGLLRELHHHGDDPLIRDLAMTFLCDRLAQDVPIDIDQAELIRALDRPLRVCGMVPNSGEPGGGPFWVRDAAGRVSCQVVEGAQIDRNNPDQAAILARSTHFNPVDMVCAVRDWQGRPYDLTRFVDDDAVIVTRKFQEGRTIRVLELPGLWNGAMADWHTQFVELPPETFNPVKTVLDLLRPAHQA
jgi:hypothetical protein